MLTTAEKIRFAKHTRTIQAELESLLSEVKQALPADKHYSPGPMVDLLQIQFALNDIAERFAGDLNAEQKQSTEVA